MLRMFRIFFSFQGANPWMVIVCLLLAGVAQGFGIATLVPLISLVEQGESASSPAAGRVITDALSQFGFTPTLEILLIVVVVAIGLKAVLTITAMYYVGKSVANVASDLRTRLVNALLKAKWRYFTSKPTGVIVNGIGLESTISGVLYLMVSRLVANTIQGTIYIGVAFFVSWKLAVASIVVGTLLIVSLQVFVRRARREGRRGIKGARELVSRLGDAIVGIKPLKAMAREDEFASLFNHKIGQIRDATRREIVSKSTLSGLQEPATTLMLAIGFYLLIVHFEQPVATVLVTGLLLQRTVNAIAKLQGQYQEAVAAESAYRSVRGMTDEAEAERELNQGTRTVAFERGAAFRNVSFAYGSTPVLKNVSFDVPAGKLTLVVGPSGAGKTTITDLLLGFHLPQSGEIVIDDVPLREIDLRSWRRRIGYVPQELILLHDSILNNITLGDPTLTQDHVWDALRLAGAEDFVASLPEGLSTVVGEKGAKLSGGQRQRIAIARALVHRPTLLILDEVTSALDTATELQICENIRALSHKMTVFAISHREAWLDVADNVVNVVPLAELE